MTTAVLNAIIEGTEGITLTLSASDLRQVVNGMVQAELRRTEEEVARNRELPVVTRSEAAKKLGVDYSTLFRWAKSGYLTPVKIGYKVFYRPSDIEEIMTKKKKQ